MPWSGLSLFLTVSNWLKGCFELAEQMVQGKVPKAFAGGIDDPENPLGTDAIQVNQAIASVYSDEGVVVLMDLGSALMSAEMAKRVSTRRAAGQGASVRSTTRGGRDRCNSGGCYWK